MNHDAEALRQQMLLRALWRDAGPAAAAGWMRDGPRHARGMQAYQANAAALAERALTAAYPVLAELVGADSFASLARAFWHRQAPLKGDMAFWGAGLPDFVAGDENLAGEPYLADVARLEWAVHQAQTAADSVAPPQGLTLLASADPAELWLCARPGTACLVSSHPVLSVWQAHQPQALLKADRFAAVRQAFAQSRAESALVWRSGWQVQVAALDAADLKFTQAVLNGLSLGQALGLSGEDFDFERWLLRALEQSWLAGADIRPSGPAAPTNV